MTSEARSQRIYKSLINNRVGLRRHNIKPVFCFINPKVGHNSWLIASGRLIMEITGIK